MAPPAASRRYRWPVSAYGGAGRPRGTAPEARYPAASIVARVPEVVRAKALAAGAAHWLRDLDDLVASLEREWSMAVGRGYDGGTEAFVAEATLADGSHAVLKPLVPRAGEAARHEITVLRLAGGRGCARLLRADEERGALLLERLGRPLHERALPLRKRHDILCSAGELWHGASSSGCRPGCCAPGSAFSPWAGRCSPPPIRSPGNGPCPQPKVKS